MAATTTAVATTTDPVDDINIDWSNSGVIAQSVFGGIGVFCCLQILVSAV